MSSIVLGREREYVFAGSREPGGRAAAGHGRGCRSLVAQTCSASPRGGYRVRSGRRSMLGRALLYSIEEVTRSTPRFRGRCVVAASYRRPSPLSARPRRTGFVRLRSAPTPFAANSSRQARPERALYGRVAVEMQDRETRKTAVKCGLEIRKLWSCHSLLCNLPPPKTNAV
jgi:hypothetical protein